jgi:hypothetical protein
MATVINFYLYNIEEQRKEVGYTSHAQNRALKNMQFDSSNFFSVECKITKWWPCEFFLSFQFDVDN